MKIIVDRINAAKETANAFRKKYKYSLGVGKRRKLELEPKQQPIRPSKYRKYKRAIIGNNIIVVGN
jgi:hypothetical protein